MLAKKVSQIAGNGTSQNKFHLQTTYIFQISCSTYLHFKNYIFSLQTKGRSESTAATPKQLLVSVVYAVLLHPPPPQRESKRGKLGRHFGSPSFLGLTGSRFGSPDFRGFFSGVVSKSPVIFYIEFSFFCKAGIRFSHRRCYHL